MLTEQLEAKRPALEQLSAKSETLVQRTADPKLSSNIMFMVSKLQTLQATAKVSVRRVWAMYNSEKVDQYHAC